MAGSGNFVVSQQTARPSASSSLVQAFLLTCSSHVSLASGQASEPRSRGSVYTQHTLPAIQNNIQKLSPNLACSTSSRRAKSILGLRLSGTRCLIACVWLVISLLGVTVPLPRLGCFNVVLPALRLNFLLSVSSSNLGRLVSIPAGDSIFQRQVIKASVTSRTPPLFGRHIALPKLYYHPCSTGCRAACHLAWASSGTRRRHFFPFLADVTPVSIVSALAPRTLVEPNLHSSCRPSLSARAFLPSKRVISDQISPPSKQPIPFRVRSRETNLINKSWSLARRSWPAPWVYGPWPESMQAVKERSHDRPSSRQSGRSDCPEDARWRPSKHSRRCRTCPRTRSSRLIVA